MQARRFCAHRGSSRTTKYLQVHPGPANTTANMGLTWFGGKGVVEEFCTVHVVAQALIPDAPPTCCRLARPAASTGGHAQPQIRPPLPEARRARHLRRDAC